MRMDNQPHFDDVFWVTCYNPFPEAGPLLPVNISFCMTHTLPHFFYPHAIAIEADGAVWH